MAVFLPAWSGLFRGGGACGVLGRAKRGNIYKYQVAFVRTGPVFLVNPTVQLRWIPSKLASWCWRASILLDLPGSECQGEDLASPFGSMDGCRQ
jgi:hypothetical protein